MQIDAQSLPALAAAYTRGMSPIRGRRVVRLICREFAGATRVACWPLAGGGSAVLGVSPGGAAFCATTGRGPDAAIIRWRHGAAQGVQTRYSLLKDSLPAVAEQGVDLHTLPLPDKGGLPGGSSGPGQDLSPWVRLAEAEARLPGTGGAVPT